MSDRSPLKNVLHLHILSLAPGLLASAVLAACSGPGTTTGGGGDGVDSGEPPISADAASSPDDDIIVEELECSDDPQNILMLDFRSGWWSGGGGGEFHGTVLSGLVQACPGMTAEYHHFEIQFRVKCIYSHGAAGQCQTLDMPQGQISPEQILSFFELPEWDDYTQVWVLSGSEQDPSDISLSGNLFGHFIAETQSSCIPIFIGAGDGFIDHANAVTTELGLGPILSTTLGFPGFFSVAEAPAISIDSRLSKGQQLLGHFLFRDVNSIADHVSHAGGFYVPPQVASGDALAETTSFEIIGRDTADRPAIAIGSMTLDNGKSRPFVLDAGLQRYYAVGTDTETLTLLQNIAKYFGLVGCKVIVD